jgi:phosphohistidine phosphatase
VPPAGAKSQFGRSGRRVRIASGELIWLLRHGDAEDGEGKPDAERELTAKGRRQSEAAGRALASLGDEIDACLTSPKVRARQTAEIACEALGLEPEDTPELAGGPFDAMALASGRGNVLLVGHEPDFSEEISRMTGSNVKLKKGGLGGVEDRLLHVLARPAELKRIAAGG